MNKRLAFIAAPVILLAASATTHAENQWGITPYVGVDAQWRHMNWGKSQGDNLFSHGSPQGNIYLGIKLSEYFGLEGGYEANVKKTRAVSINPGDTVTGIVMPSNGPTAQYNATTSIKGPHISIVGAIPVSEEYRLKILGLVGVASLKANLMRQRVATIRGGVITPALDYTPYIKRKSVLRLGAVAEHMLTDTWGVRGSLIWENTNRLRIPSINTVVPNTAKPNNSLAYGLGAFVTF